MPTGPAALPADPTYNAPSADLVNPGDDVRVGPQMGMPIRHGNLAAPGAGMFDRNVAAANSMPSDVVALAMTYTEAVSAEMSASHTFDHVAALHKKQAATNTEFRKAESDLNLARRKVQLLKRIIPVLRESTELEREALRGRLNEIKTRKEHGSLLPEDAQAETDLKIRELQARAREKILLELEQQSAEPAVDKAT